VFGVLYLVIGEYDLPFVPSNIEGIGGMADMILIPHLEAIVEAEQDGTILTGGIYAGGYKCAYICEAESKEYLVRALQSLPKRVFSRLDVFALERTEHRLAQMRERVERVQAQVE
jgi:hypothetical protein